ncbi:penicillin-binding transpeptidase domain-containing protein [Arthrobacter mobilis]|uniref:penicillin-binding transpeptidase domain-containing protein n=1 Tax=Arthrobacter mobilis TaxID=2724944 RepID=UPI001447A7B2|nr:penicillin-binding transpeptidase domain-containing protein [Arthrobacter mobilis]
MALALVAAGTACAPKDDGRSTAEALAAALTAGNLEKLEFTTAAAEVQAAFDEATEGMAPLEPKVSVGEVSRTGGDAARATLNYTWDLPDTEQDWTYAAAAEMQRTDDPEKPWDIRWSAAVVEPSLQEGEKLSLDIAAPRRGNILAAGGAAIVKDRPVKVVGIDKAGLSAGRAEDSARALAAVVGIDAGEYAQTVAGYGPEAFVEAITLREAAYRELDQDALEAIKGATALSRSLPLAPTREFASAVLGSVREATAEDIEKSGGKVTRGELVGASGLQASFNDQLSGTPGLTISAVGTPAEEGAKAPSRELYATEPVDGTDVRTTLVPRLQSAAEKILADITSPSAIVAIRPSSGAVLAAANGPDSGGYNTAFLGRYAPGSTFKVATALALLRQGKTPESTVQCDPRFAADGRRFENADGYPAAYTGTITLTEAIAHSCNTAFVSQFGNLPQEQLAEAAGALGIGMEAEIGLEAYFGEVPRDETGTAHAASMIGQGRVQVSPLALAALMASVAKGEAVVPQLVEGHDEEARLPDVPELTGQEAGQLRTMMRAAVTDGYLASLADLPGEPVIGKTGTAEYGSGAPLKTHSWVIAAQGDLAVAVFVEDGDLGSVTGAPMVKQFLQAAAG